MPDEIIPHYVTISDWVVRSGISRSRTYELIAAGELSARKVGRRTLIDLRAGLAWLDEQPAPKIAVSVTKRPHGELV